MKLCCCPLPRPKQPSRSVVLQNSFFTGRLDIMLESKWSLTVTCKVILGHSYLHPKYLTLCSLGLTLLCSLPHFTGKCSHTGISLLSTSIYRSFYFFHRMSYRLLQTFLFSAPKCITLRFQLIILFLQSLKSTANFRLSKTTLAITLSHFTLRLIATVFCIH